MYFVMLCAMFLAGTIAYLFSIEPVSIDIIEVEMTEDDYLDPSWEVAEEPKRNNVILFTPSHTSDAGNQ